MKPIKAILFDLDGTLLDVDMNVFLTGQGRFVGIHGTAETTPFADTELRSLLSAARSGLKVLFRAQRRALDLDQGGPFDAKLLLRPAP